MALLFSSLAQAQIPRTISYQGYLTSANGAATNSAGLSMLFNIYSGPTGGAALHSETQSVTVSNGIFNVMLGTTTALILPFDVPYYLGVTVGTDAEMSPRRPLAASPYAIRAASADTLAASAIVPGAQIASASVSAAKLANSGCTDGQLLQFSISNNAWVCGSPSASSGGTVTSVSTGPGLTGGPITSTGTVSLASSQLLPTIACAPGQTVKWSGSAWLCSAGSAPSFNAEATQVNSVGTIRNDVPGAFASITVGADGLPVMSYVAGGLWAAKCANAACSSSAGATIHSVELAGASGLNVGTSIITGTDGLPVISYFSTGSNTLKVVKCGDAACSPNNPNLINVVDPSSNVGQYNSIAIGADGRPVIAYYDATLKRLKVAKCDNAACTTSNYVVVDAGVPGPGQGAGVGLYNSISIGSDALPFISYYDATNNALKVVKCGDAACSTNNIISMLDWRNNAQMILGQHTAIAIGADGLPIISYYYADSSSTPTSGALYVVKCRNAACTGAFTPGTLDGGAANVRVGKYSSITIGTDGLPIVSYYDEINSALKIAKCNDAACGTGTTITTTITTLSTANTGTVNAGIYTSITIGSDGLPLVVYSTVPGPNGTPPPPYLKVLKCASTSCLPYFRRR